MNSDDPTEEQPLTSPWHEHSSPWTYPSGDSFGPPAWPPTYWVPPPPPQPPSRWRSVVALGAVVLVVGGLGAGIGIAIERGTLGNNNVLSGTNTSDLTSALVDVNTDLGGGNSAAGTGMILTSNGEVLTNNHVVEGAFSITVTLVSSGRTFSASVVGVDPTDDIAVLQLPNASGLPTVPIGNSSRVSVGDPVTAIGNALGRGGTPAVTTGQVTALGQTVTATDENGANAETLNDMIEFNAVIQPGDSGGPLVDGSGKVIGMDTAGGGRVRGFSQGSSEGFAIPINNATTIAHEIASGSTAPNIETQRTPLLGVEAQDSTTPPGALVISVQPGTPAESAGIQAQDVITLVGGTTVGSIDQLHQALLQHKPGDTVSVVWVDPAGSQHQANIQLATGAVR